MPLSASPLDHRAIVAFGFGCLVFLPTAHAQYSGQQQTNQQNQIQQQRQQPNGPATVDARTPEQQQADLERKHKTSLQYLDQYADPRETPQETAERRGDILFRSRYYSEAVPYFRQAVDLAPNNPKYHRKLASAYQKAGNLQSALDEYSLAIRFAPKDAWVKMRFAEALAEAGQYDAALIAADESVALEPSAKSDRERLLVKILNAQKSARP